MPTSLHLYGHFQSRCYKLWKMTTKLFFDKVLFSEVNVFHLSDQVNRNNCIYWAYGQPIAHLHAAATVAKDCRVDRRMAS